MSTPTTWVATPTTWVAVRTQCEYLARRVVDCCLPNRSEELFQWPERCSISLRQSILSWWLLVWQLSLPTHDIFRSLGIPHHWRYKYVDFPRGQAKKTIKTPGDQPLNSPLTFSEPLLSSFRLGIPIPLKKVGKVQSITPGGKKKAESLHLKTWSFWKVQYFTVLVPKSNHFEKENA